MSEQIKSETLQLDPQLLEKEQALVNGLGTLAVIQLSRELTFADIIGGRVPITADSTILDRSGAQIDAAELLTHVESELLQVGAA